MVLVLAIGDTHIPHRSPGLPSAFKKLLVPGKIQQVLCTGNASDKATLDFFRSIAGDVQSVRGDMDEYVHANTPSRSVVVHGSLKIGVLHGHHILPLGDPSALALEARTMGVDVLVYGGTHAFSALELDGRFYVSPGSATGVPGLSRDESVPSFVLMDVQGPALTLYIYRLVEGEVKVEKLGYAKRF